MATVEKKANNFSQKLGHLSVIFMSFYEYGRHISGDNHGQVGYCGQKCQYFKSRRSLEAKVLKSYLKINRFSCFIVLAKTAWLPYRDSKADISTMPLYQYKNRLKLMKTMIAGQFTWVVREVIIMTIN